MPNKVTAPIGDSIPVRTPYVKTAAGLTGGEIVSPATATPEIASPPAERAPAIPEKPLSLIEQFHPSLDPDKVEMTWDETSGRLRVLPKGEATPQAAESEDQTTPPALGEQHQSIPGGSEQPIAASSEAAQLRDQVTQLTQLVTVMAQAQMAGKPLSEALGFQTPVAATPSEPDYSQVDLQDPTQLAGFIRQQVQAGIQASLAPHQETIEQARRRQEYDRVAATNGADPNFNNKVVAALQLVKQNSSLTIEQGYALVNQIAQTIAPAAATAPTQPAPAAKPATRTITREEAEAKAAQAARLPGNSGVRGAGAAPMPSHIKGLGQMLAWNLQQASLGN